jgi:hypothetical protein
MVWLQRAMCGLDFKRQTYAIGILYLVSHVECSEVGFSKQR